MTVSVELDDVTLERIKLDIYQSMKHQATMNAKNALDQYIKGGQFVGEIRNAIVEALLPEIKAAVMHKLTVENKVIEKAVQSCESRINQTIHNRLINGITV